MKFLASLKAYEWVSKPHFAVNDSTSDGSRDAGRAANNDVNLQQKSDRNDDQGWWKRYKYVSITIT